MLGVIWDTVRSVNVLETNKSDQKGKKKKLERGKSRERFERGT